MYRLTSLTLFSSLSTLTRSLIRSWQLHTVMGAKEAGRKLAIDVGQVPSLMRCTALRLRCYAAIHGRAPVKPRPLSRKGE